MNEKTKAKELFDKYDEFSIPNYTSINDVKNQCIITIDEILETLMIINKSVANVKIEVVFWENVKIEIIKL